MSEIQEMEIAVVKNKKLQHKLQFVFACLFCVVINIFAMKDSVAASCATGNDDIGGTIFRDYNADGVKAILEPGYGVTGMSVTAYDDNNAVITTVNVDADGSYAFPALAVGGEKYRLELSGLPDYFKSRTSDVKFVSAANCAADFSISNPGDYCQVTPDLATNSYVNGNPTGGSASAIDALFSFPSDATGKSTSGGTPLNADATHGDIGATWGLAYKRDTKQLFSSALIKRHVGLKNGTGAIFATDYSVLPPTTALWLDINNLSGINTGSDPHTGLSGDLSASSYDPNAFDAVGKLGIGDMDISEDGETLYLINLNEKELVSIDIASKTVNSTVSIPDSGCKDSSQVIAGAYMFGLDGIAGRSLAGFEDGYSYLVNSSLEKLQQVGRMVTNDTSAPDSVFAHDVYPNSGKTLNMDIPLSDLGVSAGDALDVTLYFYAWSGVTAAGQRKFNIVLEGNNEGSVDMWVDAGNANTTPFEKTFSTTASGSSLNISLDGSAYSSSGFPYFSGVKITHSGASAGSAPADSRPWALNIKDGTVYVGVTCSAQTSGFQDDLSATVYAYDGSGFTTTFVTPLKYTRGRAYNYASDSQYMDFTTRGWYPWVSSLNQLPREVASDENNNPDGWYIQYPQPILADMAIDENQDLILSFMDRFGHQVGWGNYGTVSGDTDPIYFGQSAGDLLKACKTGSGYELEGSGSCTQSHANNRYDPSAGVTTETGAPEFFDDQFIDTLDGSTVAIHEEINSGGLAYRVGSGQVASVVFDPIDNRSGGVRTWFVDSGDAVRSYEVIEDSGSGTLSPTGYFGKSAPLGDLELICDAPPLEIGNYVWLDKDGDGIQDPAEQPIENVKVDLYLDPDGTPGNGDEMLSGSVNTNSEGEYYFGVDPGSAYYVSIDRNDPALTDLMVTLRDYGGNATHPTSGISSDLHDSDGVYNAGTDSIIVPVTTGYAGENDHTLDIGFKPLVDLSLNKTIDTSSAKRGDTVIYTITVANSLSHDATGVEVEERLPDELLYISHSGGTYDNVTGIWDVGTVAANGSRILTITVKVK